MKQKALRIGTSLFLGIVAFLALLLSVFLPYRVHIAKAVAVSTQATLAINGQSEGNIEVLAGDEITLSVHLTSKNLDNYSWAAMTLCVFITDSDGNDKASDYFVLPPTNPIEELNGGWSDESWNESYYNSSSWKEAGDESEGGTSYLQSGMQFSFNRLTNLKPASEDFTLSVKLKLKNTLTSGTVIKFATDNQTYNEAFFVEYEDIDHLPFILWLNPDDNLNEDIDGEFTANDVTIIVREKSSDNTLSSLKIRTTDTNEASYPKEGETSVTDPITFDHTDSAVLSSVYITPTANNEHATIYIAAGSTLEPKDEYKVESSKPISIDLSSGVRTVTILVVAENGATKTYTVTVVDKYVALSDLKIEIGTKTDGVTKIGLESGGAFDTTSLIYTVDLSAPLNDAYTVDVPSDYASSETGVKITPTIAEGHDIQSTVALTLTDTNGTPTNSSVESGSAVQVTGIANGDTLVVTAITSDGSKAEYVITFKLWSVDTGTLTVKVQGAEKEYVSDDEKAAEKKINYYFLLTDEAECKGKFKITPSITNIPIQIQSFGGTAENYDATKEYGAGTYTIILTADAGNTKQYVASLSKMEYLELAADSTYQFISEVTEGTGARAKSYRRAYAEMKWTHGIDDKNFEKIVLGNIAPKTTVNAFLKNISTSQHSMIRIYNNKGKLVYNCGAAGEDFDAENFDKWNKLRVSTSWYVQYGGTEENPLDTVYISVLGDISCNGLIDSSDASRINTHAAKLRLLEELEVRLAAYVVNNRGTITTSDSSKINLIIMSKDNIENYFYKPETETTGE